MFPPLWSKLDRSDLLLDEMFLIDRDTSILLRGKILAAEPFGVKLKFSHFVHLLEFLHSLKMLLVTSM